VRHVGHAVLARGRKVEHGEDSFDAVIREVAEESGCDAVVERLIGVDSRVVPVTGHVAPVPVGGLIEH
jgi:8-oxo-dGTP diphosphatase